MPVSADTITVKTDIPTSISLKHNGNNLETKEINGVGEFNIPEGDVGKYRYEITDGETVFNIDQYIVYEGDKKVSSIISYIKDEKQNEISFTHPTETETIPPTESVPPTETEPPTETIPPTESEPGRTSKTTNVNTGDVNYIPILIGASAAAGAGIGVAVYFLKRKRGDSDEEKK